MSGPSFPDHLLTLDEWAALPEYERYRVEMCEGVLVVSPHPGYLHQHVTFTLVDVLAGQLPDGLCVLGDVEVLLPGEPPTVRCPDVIVVDRALVEADPDRATAADVRLVVEVTSGGSGRTDRVTKFSEYAEGGIPQYWIVDLTEPAVLAAFILENGWYRFDGEHGGTVTLTAAGHDVTVDLEELTVARAGARSASGDAPVTPDDARPR
ncbi:Uma2 family endonuclease [Rhodococcus zopfii]|uniref:Uma2 family endonuclease n=1 Tax=Rhodococcus zopfii TaxID=43772 RepID=A0ABU3WSD8_9NOCA|nr:Uma2 family endonuclease [Rhodococcus zopfii]